MQAREKACKELLAQACRHAPTILDYKPSYKGVLKKKEKKKEGELSEKDKQKRGDQTTTGATQKKREVAPNAGGARKKRQAGVRLSKIGYTAEEWLTPLGGSDIFEPMLLGLNIPL